MAALRPARLTDRSASGQECRAAGRAVAGHRLRRQEVGLHELSRRLWGADIAFSQPGSTTMLVGRFGLLGPTHRLSVGPPASGVLLPLLGQEWLHRVVQVGSRPDAAPIPGRSSTRQNGGRKNSIVNDRCGEALACRIRGISRSSRSTRFLTVKVAVNPVDLKKKD